MKKLPVLDVSPGKFGIDQVLGSFTISEEMAKRIAFLAYNIKATIVLHPVVNVNSEDRDLIAFNISYDTALSKNETVSEKLPEQKLPQTLCRNCSQPHKLREEDAGRRRGILRLCEKCFKNLNTDNVALPFEDDINQIAKRVYNLAVSKGWHDDNETEDSFLERTCNNMHDEVSELHEAWRNNKLHDLCDKADEMEKNNIKPLTYIEEELADIIIRAMDSAVKLGVDIGDAINRKHLYNSTRKQRHGGKRS